MHLATEYFEKIKNSTKTIECRVGDEKRQKLNVGDHIEFIDAQNEHNKIMAKIIALHQFSSFRELLDHFPVASLGDKSKDESMAAFKKFYSNKEEKEYGVLGIEIKLI